MQKTISRSSGRSGVGAFLANNFGGVLIVLMVLFGIIYGKNFLTSMNLQNLVKQIAINGILTVGFSVVYIVDGFDLSMGSVQSLCCCVALSVLNATYNIFLAIAVALVIGVTFGFINGMICKSIKGDGADSYLITLAMSLVALGCAYVYTTGNNIQCADIPAYRNIARGSILGIPNLAIILAVLLIVTQFFLRKTKAGRRLYYVGSNKTSAYMSGIDAHNYRMLAFMFSGLCAAIAAIIMTGRTGSASATCASGYETDAAIATIVGGNAVGDSRSGMTRALIGILCLGLMSNIMNLMNINSYIQTIVKGVVLLVALYAQRFKMA